MTAPATIGAGIPILSPMPIPATPIVPIVDHELPIESATTAQIRQIVNKKYAGEMIFSPK
jgi:hypothetical protein